MAATARQIEIHEAYLKNGCQLSTTAKAMGITRNSCAKNLFYAARNGLCVTPDQFSPVAPVGWSSVYKTVQYNADGVVQTWDRVKPDEMAIEQLWKYLKERTPVADIKIDPPGNANTNLMLEWLIADQHLGLHSWAKETGADYDLKIAKQLIINAAQKIFSLHGNVGESVIVLGGDNIHADNRSNTTEKSHHSLDVDSRYAKSVDAIYSGMTTSIDIALVYSETVKVIVLSGNHDYHSAINLARILSAHYRSCDRVSIDTSPAKHKFHRFGSNYFLYTHGDTGTNNRLSAYLMNHLIREGITGIDRMYVRKGHLHKRGKVFPPGMTEEDGVVVELFPTLAAPDSFAHEQAYSSVRATVANVWHSEYGQRSRMELGVKELMEDGVRAM